MYVCIHIYIYIYVYMHIHMYTYIMHIHIYIYIYMLSLPLGLREIQHSIPAFVHTRAIMTQHVYSSAKQVHPSIGQCRFTHFSRHGFSDTLPSGLCFGASSDPSGCSGGQQLCPRKVVREPFVKVCV